MPDNTILNWVSCYEAHSVFEIQHSQLGSLTRDVNSTKIFLFIKYLYKDVWPYMGLNIRFWITYSLSHSTCHTTFLFQLVSFMVFGTKRRKGQYKFIRVIILFHSICKLKCICHTIMFETCISTWQYCDEFLWYYTTSL